MAVLHQASNTRAKIDSQEVKQCKDAELDFPERQLEIHGKHMGMKSPKRHNY